MVVGKKRKLNNRGKRALHGCGPASGNLKPPVGMLGPSAGVEVQIVDVDGGYDVDVAE